MTLYIFAAEIVECHHCVPTTVVDHNYTSLIYYQIGVVMEGIYKFI